MRAPELFLHVAIVLSVFGFQCQPSLAFVSPQTSRRSQQLPLQALGSLGSKPVQPLGFRQRFTMRLDASEEGWPVEDSSEQDNLESRPLVQTDQSRKSLWGRLASFYKTPDDGLTFKQRLAKYGIAAVLSYLFISNVSGCIAVSCAWYIFSATNKVSPLAPGQWKGFLAIYSGFFLFLNVIRPLRFALAISISPQFDRIMNTLQRRYNASRAVAIGWTVALFNVCGSFAVLFIGVFLASLLSGVPVWPTR